MSPFFLSLDSCVKDDIVQDEVDPVIRITNPLDTIGIGTTYLFLEEYLNNVGQKEDVDVEWESSDTSIISIDQNGMAEAKVLGQAIITVTSLTDPPVSATNEIVVGNSTVATTTPERTGSLTPASFYPLAGDFTLKDENGVATLALASNYEADTRLPGLYVYLSNNTASFSNALEIGKVVTFNGAHSYTLPAGTDINSYQYVLYFCKPFNVAVGDGMLN